MRKPAITVGGALLSLWGGVQVYSALAGAYADGTDFNAYLGGLARRVMNSLTGDVFVLAAGLALVAWGQFSERIKAFLGLRQPSEPAALLSQRLPDAASAQGSADMASKLAKTATREELHKVRVELNELKESFAQGAEAFRVLETKAKLKFLERMQKFVPEMVAKLAVIREEMPSDTERVRDWISSKTMKAEEITYHLADSLQKVGFNGHELMRIHLSDANEYVSSRVKFRTEPDFLDVPPEIKKHYHSCIMRLEMMRGEYKKTVDQLRSKAEIDLHL